MPPLQGAIPDILSLTVLPSTYGASNYQNFAATGSTSSAPNLTTSGNQQGNSRTNDNMARDHSSGWHATNSDAPHQLLRSVSNVLRSPLLQRYEYWHPLPSAINNNAGVPNYPLHLPLPVNNCSSDAYKLFPVDPKTPEFRTLEKLLDPLSVCHIDQIVNPTVWNRFVDARKEMLMRKCDDPMLLKEFGLSDEEIAQERQSLNFFRHKALDAAPFDDNFSLLFHCTKDPANVELILRNGFDERLSKGGSLGKGIYFADKSMKSVMYDRMGSGVVFICGVLLGDCIGFQAYPRRCAYSPKHTPSKMPAEHWYIDDFFFDSVMGQFGFNEYAVYNRYQCCPLYKVTYSKLKSTFDVSHLKIEPPPSLAWLHENEFHKMVDKSTWAHQAQDVFDEIKGPKAPSLMDRPTSSMPTLKENDFHVGSGIDSNLQRNAGVVKKLVKGVAKELSCNDNTLNKLRTELPTTEPLDRELCLICCESYSERSLNWKKLPQCEHKLCAKCYSNIEINRKTMASVSHTSIKCPFCQLTFGIPIGTCPNGEMEANLIPSHCEGYEDCSTIMITYTVNKLVDFSATQLSSYKARRREAFLPNNEEGRNVLFKLRDAWERRLVLTIGTSYTTGQENALVWNIHHKTMQTGGVAFHGYPDATYLERVRAELKGFGVE